jgi:ATP-dependent DNA helicase RecG
MSPRRTPDELLKLIEELLSLPRETEWLEDKQNNSDPGTIGEYVSALANSAALAERDHAYILGEFATMTEK